MIRTSLARRSISALLLVTGLSACETAPEPATEALESRFAGPCQRLIVTWRADAEALQALVGPALSVRETPWNTVQLRIFECGRRSAEPRQSPLRFAYVAVPIVAESVPLAITGIPDGGWWAMPVVLTDPASTDVLTAMGYRPRSADIELSVPRPASQLSARINFRPGSVEIAAALPAASTPHDAGSALITHDMETVTAFFGKETGRRFELQHVAVRQHGRTPLDGLTNLTEPQSATLDRELRADRVVWRMPVVTE